MFTKLKLACYALVGTSRTVRIQWQNTCGDTTSAKLKQD